MKPHDIWTDDSARREVVGPPGAGKSIADVVPDGGDPFFSDAPRSLSWVLAALGCDPATIKAVVALRPRHKESA